MATSITSSATSSLAQQLIDLKNSSKSSLISTIFSSDNDELTQTILDASTAKLSISGISSSMNAISAAARKNNVSDEVITNIQKFAQSLQRDGYDTVSALKRLATVRSLAEDDPGKLSELFSDENVSNISSTITGLTNP